jgi:hypothetical protein
MTIPNVFHFVFGLRPQTEPFHLMYYLCLASCIGVNKPDAVVFHYYHEPFGPWWDRIKPKLVLKKITPEQFVDNYNYADKEIAEFRYAHLADFARLEILLAEGGIYADIDSVFLKPLPRDLLQHECVMGFEKSPASDPSQRSLCNAWIAAKPHSAFCRAWLDAMPEAFDGSWSNHSTLLPYRLSQQHPEWINVQPEASFFALDWTAKSINNLFLRRVALPENSYSLHLWNHLWFDSNRLDFSYFNQQLLTADYVAFADTTYARAARRWLPQDVVVSQAAYLRQRQAAWRAFPWQAFKVAVGLK